MGQEIAKEEEEKELDKEEKEKNRKGRRWGGGIERGGGDRTR